MSIGVGGLSASHIHAPTRIREGAHDHLCAEGLQRHRESCQRFPFSTNDPLGLFWATLNAALFVGYIILGHKASDGGASGGVDHLGAAMAIAFVILMPIGFLEAVRTFGMPIIALAGIGVGICSSVIPYVCDQLAMSGLPRASFALLLVILPATATIIAAIVLAQIPTSQDVQHGSQ